MAFFAQKLKNKSGYYDRPSVYSNYSIKVQKDQQKKSHNWLKTGSKKCYG